MGGTRCWMKVDSSLEDECDENEEIHEKDLDS